MRTIAIVLIVLLVLVLVIWMVAWSIERIKMTRSGGSIVTGAGWAPSTSPGVTRQEWKRG